MLFTLSELQKLPQGNGEKNGATQVRFFQTASAKVRQEVESSVKPHWLSWLVLSLKAWMRYFTFLHTTLLSCAIEFMVPHHWDAA